MRAVKFILFGILLVLTGTFAPPAVTGLLYMNSGTLNPVLGPNGFYLYLMEVVLIALGLVMGLIGFFQRDTTPVSPVADLHPDQVLNGSRGPQETLSSDIR